MAVVADLPTVLDADERDRYRRIFQAQAAGQFAPGRRRHRPGQGQDPDGLCQRPAPPEPAIPGEVPRARPVAAGLQRPSRCAGDLQARAWRAARRARPRSRRRASSASRSRRPPSPRRARRAAPMPARPPICARACRAWPTMVASTPPSPCSTASRRSTCWGRRRSSCGRGRMRTRALEADSQRGVQVPIESRLPPDANWTAGLAAFKGGNYAEAARRFEAVADAAPDQASSWTLSAGSFWAGRANLLAGNPQKFAPYLKRAALHGRTFHGLIAQKALGHAHRARLERAGARPPPRRRPEERPRRPARARPVPARRPDRGRARAVRAPRSTPTRNIIETVMALAQKANRCPAWRCASATPTGTSATPSRAMTAPCIRCRRGSPPAAIRSIAR